jgi:hypothetical protein
MFIGVSGNAPFLETYWRHKLLTYTLALAGGDSRQNPRNAPMNSGGCHSPRRWRIGAKPRHWWNGAASLVLVANALPDGVVTSRQEMLAMLQVRNVLPTLQHIHTAIDTRAAISQPYCEGNAASILRTCCNV